MLTPAHSFVSLVERMDILELEQKHFIQATKERFRDMERRSEAQFAKMDERFDRLEEAFDRSFSQVIWLQLIGYWGLGFWLLNTKTPTHKIN